MREGRPCNPNFVIRETLCYDFVHKKRSKRASLLGGVFFLSNSQATGLRKKRRSLQRRYYSQDCDPKPS